MFIANRNIQNMNEYLIQVDGRKMLQSDYFYYSDKFEELLEYESSTYDEDYEDNYEYNKLTNEDFDDYVASPDYLHSFIRNTKSCSTSEHQRSQYRISAVIYFFLFYSIPSLAIITLYMKLFRDYWYKADQNFRDIDRENTVKMLKCGGKRKLPLMKSRILLTPVLISVSFIFFWLPFAMVEVLKTFGIFPQKSSSCDTINFVTEYLTWTQCAIWPFLYLFTATSWSKRVKKLKKLVCKKPASNHHKYFEKKSIETGSIVISSRESSSNEIIS